MNKFLANSFGRRLKNERERLGFDQASVCEKVDVTSVTLSHYENDKRSPTADTLIKMVKLGYDPYYLLKGGGGTVVAGGSPDSLGRRLKNERERLGFEQTYVAEQVNISVVALSNYENNKRSPSADFLMSLAKVGYDSAYLITGNKSGAVVAADDLAWLDLINRLSDEDKSRAFVMLSALLPKGGSA